VRFIARKIQRNTSIFKGTLKVNLLAFNVLPTCGEIQRGMSCLWGEREIMGKSFFISTLIHSLLIGVLFFNPAMRRNFYPGDRIQPVYLVKEPEMPSGEKSSGKEKEKATFIRPRMVLSSYSPLELKSLKEKILEKYSDTEEKKKSPEEKIEKKAREEEPAPPMSKKKASLLFLSPFPYPWYVTLLKNKIYTNWSPPSKFSILQEEAFSAFSFRIFKDGSIEKIRLKESSNVEILDQSARKSIEMIRDLPSLPDDWKEEYLDVTVRFSIEE